jgi:hypothetical protein
LQPTLPTNLAIQLEAQAFDHRYNLQKGEVGWQFSYKAFNTNSLI